MPRRSSAASGCYPSLRSPPLRGAFHRPSSSPRRSPSIAASHNDGGVARRLALVHCRRRDTPGSNDDLHSLSLVAPEPRFHPPRIDAPAPTQASGVRITPRSAAALQLAGRRPLHLVVLRLL